MTITKKPHATEAKATSPAIPETDIQALIEKGGSVAHKGGGENSSRQQTAVYSATP